MERVGKEGVITVEKQGSRFVNRKYVEGHAV